MADQVRARQGASARLTATVVDEDGAAVPAASITALTLTLYDKSTGGIINGREAQDVLNDNGVTVNSSGELVWDMDAADNAVVNALKPVERHVALFEWTFSGGRQGNHEVYVDVEAVPNA